MTLVPRVFSSSSNQHDDAARNKILGRRRHPRRRAAPANMAWNSLRRTNAKISRQLPASWTLKIARHWSRRIDRCWDLHLFSPCLGPWPRHRPHFPPLLALRTCGAASTAAVHSQNSDTKTRARTWAIDTATRMLNTWYYCSFHWNIPRVCHCPVTVPNKLGAQSCLCWWCPQTRDPCPQSIWSWKCHRRLLRIQCRVSFHCTHRPLYHRLALFCGFCCWSNLFREKLCPHLHLQCNFN